MIDFISKWAGQLVVALIIGSLLEMIIPKGKNKKYVKMLIGIYIIFCMISPFVNSNESFSIDDIGKTVEKYVNQNVEEVNQTSMDARLEDLYIEELEKKITEDVETIGYKVTKCKVDAVLKGNEEEAGIKKISIKVKKYIKENQTSEIEKIENIEISINEEKKENTTNIDKEDVKNIKRFILEKYEIEENKIHISG